MRITGSPLHEPMVLVQSVPVPAVLLQPTVYVRPATQEKVPLLRHPHSRLVPS